MSPDGAPPEGPSVVRAAGRAPTTLLLGTTLVLTALNLRAAATSVGAVLRDMQAALGMSDAVAGLLTTLPVVCFGAIGLVAGRLGRRFGTDRLLVTSLVLITIGLVVRAAAPTVGWVLVTSVVALTGMAIGNVLVPVAVKAWFPRDVGKWTGLYSMGVVAGTAIPLAVTVPLGQLFGGWRFGLGAWAIPAALALIPWLLVFHRSRGRVVPVTLDGVLPSSATAAGAKLTRSVKAWALMAFFGLQSLEAYVAMGWLPSIFQDAGISATSAGLLTGLAMGLSVPIAVLVPTLAARSPDQRPWVVVLITTSVVGYLGLWLSPGSLPALWASMLGIGFGAFPLALLLIGLRTATSRTTSELSSLVQGWGYLLAALGPVSIGVLREVTGGWDVPLAGLLLLLVPKLVSGLIAGAPGYIDAGESSASET